MILDEVIKTYTSNAEYERTHGNLQGCLDFKELAEWLKELKRLREQTRWIPVSERLPEEQDEYLVTWTAKGFRDKPFMRMIEFDVEDREWILDKDMKEIFKDVTITAWQPLPESYKENKE